MLVTVALLVLTGFAVVQCAINYSLIKAVCAINQTLALTIPKQRDDSE